MSDDRSQSPTPRRRRFAREQGHVARSTELASSIGFVSAVSAIVFCGPGLMTSVTGLLRRQLRHAAVQRNDAEELQQISMQMLTGLLPLLGLICAAVLVAQIVQTGFLWQPRRIVPDLGRINPQRGIQRIISPWQLVRLFFQMAKIVVIVAVAVAVMRGRLPELLTLGAYPPLVLFQKSLNLMSGLLLTLGLAVLAMGVLDYAYQRWKYENDLRMTPEELRQEVRAVHNDLTPGRRRAQARRSLPSAGDDTAGSKSSAH